MRRSRARLVTARVVAATFVCLAGLGGAPQEAARAADGAAAEPGLACPEALASSPLPASSPAGAAAAAPPETAASAAEPAASRSGPPLVIQQPPRVVPGREWRRARVVSGGREPYRCRLVGPRPWPSELRFNGRTGELEAPPVWAAVNGTRFTVEITDSTRPPQRVRRELTLVVGPLPAAPAAASAPPAASARASEPALPEVRGDDGHVVYRLTLADLSKVFPPVPAAASASASASASAPAPAPAASGAAAAAEAEVDIDLAKLVADEVRRQLAELKAPPPSPPSSGVAVAPSVAASGVVAAPRGAVAPNPAVPAASTAGGANAVGAASAASPASAAVKRPAAGSGPAPATPAAAATTTATSSAATTAALEAALPKDTPFLILAPLLDVEYPTVQLFAAAVRARQCAVFKGVWKAVAEAEARKRYRPPELLECEYPDRGLARLPAGAADLGQMLFRRLLSDEDLQRLASEAVKVYTAAESPPPAWQDVRCGCVPPLKEDLLVSIYPAWHARSPAPRLRFDHFHRVGVIGPRLLKSGLLDEGQAKGWRAAVSELSRQAHRHGTQLDFVVHRHDWTDLTAAADDALPTNASTKALREAYDARERRVRAAAESGADMVIGLVSEPVPSQDWEWQPFLFDWQEKEFLFDGVSVFFDDLPRAADGTLQPLYVIYFRAFMDRLSAGMQATGRSLSLSLVLGDDLIGTEPPFDFQSLMSQVLEKTEWRGASHIPEGAELDRYLGKPGSAVRVRFIVPMREPTTHYKKRLRERIDRSTDVHGHRRVALLNAVVPLIFVPESAVPLPVPAATREAASAAAAGLPKPPPAPAEPVLWRSEAKDQVNDDIAYYQWSFGGMGFWTAHEAEAGPSAGQQALEMVDKTYPMLKADGLASEACGWVCTHRRGVRLGFEVLLLALLGSVGTFVFAAWPRRMGLRYRALMWALLLAMLASGFALLVCDPAPAIARAREGNWILFYIVSVVMLVALWFTIKQRRGYPVP